MFTLVMAGWLFTGAFVTTKQKMDFTPVISLTNNREGDWQRLPAGRGMPNDFIVKPVSREALLKASSTLESS